MMELKEKVILFVNPRVDTIGLMDIVNIVEKISIMTAIFVRINVQVSTLKNIYGKNAKFVNKPNLTIN